MSSGETRITTGHELLAHLRDHKHAIIDQWFVCIDEHGLWLTNSYGVDCGLVEASVEGCQSALDRIADDTHECEWV